MKADDFPRHLDNRVKSDGVLDLVHTDVMGPMQTKTPGGYAYVVTFIDEYSRHVTVYFMKAKSDVLFKFEIYKAAIEIATDKKIKPLHSDNGGEYTGRQFKIHLNLRGIKHEKTVPYTPRQNELAERLNRSLIEMARCMLYHEGIEKKWYVEVVITAAWVINRIPNSVTVKTPYAIVYRTKPQLKNMKVFGALGYGTHQTISVNIETGKVHIMRTVQFVNTTSPGNLVTHGEEKYVDGTSTAPTLSGSRQVNALQIAPVEVPAGDVFPLQRETIVNDSILLYDSTHPMITWSRTRHTDEPTDLDEEGARKKRMVASYEVGRKRQWMPQERQRANDQQLATCDGCQAMAAKT
ncbi:hypothetical protein PC117_g23843 [Phytophthora cactorum]|uniref:Integrase catalytic domain-containing protein n=1 Tax=Phytophthora cactorum TaxID=29920 RepID=A0A8T1B326_9STRA|nr:hypothetical protein PC117_g23843 [Phytophthora cactorum]